MCARNLLTPVQYLKKLESFKNLVPTFVDCDESDIKLYVKEEETFEEDPLFNQMEDENIEEMQDEDSPSREQNSDSDEMNTVDIKEHKIEISLNSFEDFGIIIY